MTVTINGNGTITGLAIDSANINYTAAGGTARTIASIFGETARVTDYGADPTGATDSTTAFQTAIASGKRYVYVPQGTYLISSTLNLNNVGQTLIGVNQRQSIIKKNFAGDLINISASYVTLERLWLEGNGGSFSGRGVIVSDATTPNIVFRDCQIINFLSYCVEFTASTAGSGFIMDNCRAYTTGQIVAAVKTAVDSGGTPRRFINCQSSGGNFLDCSGADNVQVTNCALGGTGPGGLTPIITDNASKKVIISSSRFFNGGGSITLSGQDCTMTGCAVAGDVFLGSGSVTNAVVGCVVAGNIEAKTGATQYTISGSRAANIIDTARDPNSAVDIPLTTYTPAWTASSVNPSLGNGTLLGNWSRRRDMIRVNILLTIGSTTTLGTGNWIFSLPFVRDSGGNMPAVGVASISCAGAFAVGTVVADPGSAAVTIYPSSGGTQVGPAVPGAWANGNRLWIQIDVPIK